MPLCFVLDFAGEFAAPRGGGLLLLRSPDRGE